MPRSVRHGVTAHAAIRSVGPMNGCAVFAVSRWQDAGMSRAETTGHAPARRASLRTLTPAVLVLIAVGITLATALIDHDTTASRSGLARVTFGLPLDWLVQDQSSLDPPFPWNATFISPWENPVSVALFPVVFGGIAVYAVLLAGLFVVRFTRSRLSS
jgi:hypothetical protein